MIWFSWFFRKAVSVGKHRFFYVLQAGISIFRLSLRFHKTIQKMIRNLKWIALSICALLICGSLSAQNKAKYAHLNSSDLMQVMPGRDSAQKVLETLNAQLEEELKLMYSEYQNKVNQFQQDQATMSQAMQQAKMQDLEDLKKRIETFQEQAQGELQEKQEELLKPLVDKAKAAIAKVAKENGYTYVFDTAVGTLLYYDGGEDIIEQVKKELGIK